MQNEYASIWREIKRVGKGDRTHRKYTTRYSRNKVNGVWVGLQLFEKHFQDIINGYPLSYEEYDRFMICTEAVIKDLYLRCMNMTEVWAILDKVDNIRVAQYYVYRKLKNNLRRKQRAGEVLSDEEMMVVRWNKIY